MDDTTSGHGLYINSYAQEYLSLLSEAADLLHKAGNLSSSPRFVLSDCAAN